MCRSFVRSPPKVINSITFDSAVIPSTTTEDTAEVITSSPLKLKHCVQHNYHDHIYDKIPIHAVDDMSGKCGVSVPFPQKLYEMLDYIESTSEPELADIISWQPHGRCFLVRKPKEFTNVILPRFFQQKKYASFQRQLNLYGFNRLTKGPDRGSYYHELFLRGKPFLCRGINRIKIKGTGARMASNPDTEPDFYSMPASGVSSPVSVSKGNHGGSSSSLTMPSLPSFLLNDTASVTQNQLANDDLEFVFDGMPFHTIEASRRNSLMSRRDSQPGDYFRRSSFVTPNPSNVDLNIGFEDDIIFKEMDVINSLGIKLSDDEMGHILDKIIS